MITALQQEDADVESDIFLLPRCRLHLNIFPLQSSAMASSPNYWNLKLWQMYLLRELTKPKEDDHEYHT